MCCAVAVSMAKLLLILGLVALASVASAAYEGDYGSSGNSSEVTVKPSSTTKSTSHGSKTPSHSNSSTTVAPTKSTSHGSSTSSKTPSHSNSSTVAPTSPTHAPTPTPTPSSTPSSPPPPPPSPPPVPVEYYAFPAGNNSCIRVNASISFMIQYMTKDNKNKTVNVSVVDAEVDTNHSFCNHTFGKGNDIRMSRLFLRWEHQGLNYSLNLTFIGNFAAGSRQWNISNTTVHIPYELVDKMVAQQPINETLVASTDDLTSMMLDYEQSFSCNTQRNITMNVANISSLPKTNIATFYNVTIKVKSFRVQAFQFGSPSSPSKYFGAEAICSEDNQDNKIVPIAVGAALAGLVIIVLIAYIIGRLRSRKQGSYEALS